MSKELFEVNIRLYVMAKDFSEAKQVAIDEAGYELDMCDFEIHKATSFPQSWKGAIPFGGDDDRTVDEIVGMAQEAREK